MDKGGNGFLYRLGFTLGTRDRRNRVSWLTAHLVGLPVDKEPLQERAGVRSIVYSFPCAQVGTINSEYHPQHRVRCPWRLRSHWRGSAKRCRIYMLFLINYYRRIRRKLYVAKRRRQRYFPSACNG